MERTFKITVDGHEYHVTVEEITEVGSVMLPDAGSMHIPQAAAPPAAAPSTKVITADSGDEVSPLGGTVASVDVSVGQAVKTGDKIASIEAMKMCTVVVAHHDGTVARIDVKTGDAVEQGQVLLNIT